MTSGKEFETTGWILFVISVIGFFFSMSVDPGIAGSCCCFGLIGLVIAQVGYDKRKKERLMVYVQPPPVVLQQFVQQPVYIPTPAPAPAPAPPPPPVPQPTPKPAPPPPEHSTEQWLNKARNLETARDWLGAAQAYQKAGLFSEAGRVRETYLEEDKDKVVLNIDRIGDTVLHDSVMVNEEDKKDPQDTTE